MIFTSSLTADGEQLHIAQRFSVSVAQIIPRLIYRIF
jgi:hypothetical protein